VDIDPVVGYPCAEGGGLCAFAGGLNPYPEVGR
jgi:hypothetical protein